MRPVYQTPAAFGLACAILATMVSVSAAESLRYGYTADELIELYIDTTLTAEGGLITAPNRLVKWPSDKTVRVITFPLDSIFDEPGRHIDLIDRTKRIVDDVAASTPAPTVLALGPEEMDALVQNGPPPDPTGVFKDTVVVIFGSRAEIVSVAAAWASRPGPEGHLMGRLPAMSEADPVCAALWVADSQSYELSGAFVLIDAETSHLDQCIYEEFMQSFGLMNDFPAGTASIFNDDNLHQEPTELDWLLWRVHADPWLEAGMDEAAVREVAREVIASLIAE